jgi:predicted DNA-binding helix-hairpin-helix protein
MDTLQKLESIGQLMMLEPAEEVGALGAASPLPRSPFDATAGCGAGADEHFVHHAVMPGGQRIALLKTLQTSACERDCYYCPFRAGRDFRRATFTPDEMARVFSEMAQRKQVEGIFLSSGIAGGGVRTQDRIVATAEILRRKYEFRGYIHLKIMPGAQADQIRRAMQLANRVSVNLEAPNTERLARLAPHKVFLEELVRPLKLIESIRRESPGLGMPSSTTQFVVGGADENDREILVTASRLIREARLSRVYFSAFHPIPDTPLENRAPTHPLREHRLYQSDFLLRQYGFQFGDLVFGADGNLPIDTDPKVAWAQLHLAHAPIELNRAGRGELLRVPGIGPKTVDVILRERNRGRLRELTDLRKLGIIASRAAPFILLDGRRPAYQLPLWH